MLLVIDNYDSFTYNLVHFLGELGAPTRVVRNDQIAVGDALALRPDGIVLSPGPCDPDKAGICLDLIAAAAGQVPLLGVCLGHQAIGQAFGGRVVRAPMLMHGKVSDVEHDGSGLFAGQPNPLSVTRYHSLSVDPDSVPPALAVNARAADGTIMGLRHRELPIHGVQFHPESIASEAGHDLLRAFVDLTQSKQAA
jgi:anthranilate synthase component 2